MSPLEIRRIRCALMGILIFIGATGHLPTCFAQADHSIDGLIRQLSSDSYTTRKRASRSLIEMSRGPHYQPIVEALADNPSPPSDLERYVAKKRLLAEIQHLRRETQINRFLYDQLFDHDSVAGWVEFKQHAGGGDEARRIFATALRSHQSLVDQLTFKGTRTGLPMQSMIASCDSIDRRDIPAWCVTLCGFCDTQIARTSSPMAIRMAAVMRSPGLGPYPIHEDEHRVLSTVVASYLRHAPIELCDRIVIGVRYGCDDLVQSDCRRVLSDPLESPARIVTALLAASIQKGLESEVEEWLNRYRDDSRVSHVWQSMLRPRRTHRTQVRDVALALTIHRSGIDPRSRGFVALLADPILVFQPQSLGFETDEQRRSAHERTAE